MNLDAIHNLVKECFDEYFAAQGRKDYNPDGVMLGEGGQLDSMDLVSLVIDIETKFMDAGHTVSLTGRDTMGNWKSIFSSLDSLSRHIAGQIQPA